MRDPCESRGPASALVIPAKAGIHDAPRSCYPFPPRSDTTRWAPTMPLLLFLPLALLALVALWLLLLPISLWTRYASGRARRRAQGWVIRGNAWLLACSVPLLLLSA